MAASTTTDTRLLSESIWVERHEGKYIIPISLIPQIREFIRPFCDPDPNGTGDPPEYLITTMQLDTPSLSLHHAKEDESVARFKLRARTYGTDAKSPVFVELKRKIKGVVVKSRARIPRDKWCRELILDARRILDVEFRSTKEEYAFLEFVRLVRQIGASPKVLVRYTRESYVSHVDDYARVTFDRNLLCMPAESWTDWGEGKRWRRMDSSMAQDKGFLFSGVVLELKAMSNVPEWLVELVEKFNLARVGNCKYSSAIWIESVFRGTTAAPEYASELFVV
ncbi:MAG: polyphosphate polymerase domain-containing protein [bacterium]